jgi:Flp pilus assembly protein TadG
MSSRPFRKALSGVTRPLRRGVAVFEAAVVLVVFLSILFVMLDLGLIVLYYNLLCDGASHLCREAIVHGSMSAPQETMWGPGTVTGNMADGSDYSGAIQQDLVSLTLKDVNYSLVWLSDANQPNDQVQATLTYQYTPMIPYVLGSEPITLKAVATMRVLH